MRIKMKRFFGILLSLALVLGLMPGMSLTAAAATNTHTYAQNDAADVYPIWIGGVQVTSENMSGDGWSYTPATTGETPAPATLTLNNYTYSGLGHSGAYSDVSSSGVIYPINAAIYSEQPLKITLIGDSSVTAAEDTSPDEYIEGCGIYSVGDLTIDGDGSLTASGVTGEGICSEGNVTISGGKVIASGGYNGILALGEVTISGGKVEATGSDPEEEDNANGIYAIYGVTISSGEVTVRGNQSGINAEINKVMISGGTVTVRSSEDGIFSESGSVTISGGKVTVQGEEKGIHACSVTISGGEVTVRGNQDGILTSSRGVAISGGTVTVQGEDGCGIVAEDGNVTIGEQITSLIVTGGNGAVNATVKNAIAGTGWSNVRGTKRKADIAVSTEGQSLDSYRKVQFPAVEKTADDEYPLWVGGKQVTKGNASDVFGDGKVSYTPATTGETPAPATLTLNNYTYSGFGHRGEFSYDSSSEVAYLIDAAIYSEEPLKITLKGDSSVTTEKNTSPDKYICGCGVYSAEDLTIDGNGSLTAKGVSGEGIWSEGNVTINGGKVTASGAYNGILAYKKMTISGGEVEATGNGLGEEENLDDVHGIYADLYGVTISGGTVTVRSIEEGILTWWGDLTISGGTVTVKADWDGILAYSSGVTISGGTVNIQGGQKGIESVKPVTISGGEVTVRGDQEGILAYQSGVTINGGEVTVQGDQDGIFSYGESVMINGGTVTATGKDGCGIITGYGNGTVTVAEQITSLIVTGGSGAFGGTYDKSAEKYNHATVKNAIAGTGWTNVNGTKGRADIAVSTEGQSLESYKKVQFPAVKKPADDPSGGGGDSSPADPVRDVTDMIDKIPYPVSAEDADAVKAAREAYNALTDAQKALVDPAALKTLQTAEFDLASADARTKKVKFKSVKAKKGRKAQISWTKNLNATGYQLEYSTSRKFTKKTTKKTTIKSNKTVKKTVGKLKKGRTYYFRVRPYTKVYNGVTGKKVTVYGKWSGKQKCKAK